MDRLESLEVLIPGPQRGEGDGRPARPEEPRWSLPTDGAHPTSRAGAMNHLWRVGGRASVATTPFHHACVPTSMTANSGDGDGRAAVPASSWPRVWWASYPIQPKAQAFRRLGLFAQRRPTPASLPSRADAPSTRERLTPRPGRRVGSCARPTTGRRLVPIAHIQVRQRPGVRRRRHGRKVGVSEPYEATSFKGPRPCAGG